MIRSMLPIRALSFGQDGKMLAVGGDMGLIKLYNFKESAVRPHERGQGHRRGLRG